MQCDISPPHLEVWGWPKCGGGGVLGVRSGYCMRIELELESTLFVATYIRDKTLKRYIVI